MGTWEVVAMDLVEKSVTIPSAKKPGRDRAHCMHPWVGAGVSEPQPSLATVSTAVPRLSLILGQD